MYGQTAELLHHTLKNIEVMHASELGKEALRILCERLCAICCMRQAAHAPNKYEDMARRIGAVIKDHGAQLAVAAAAGWLGDWLSYVISGGFWAWRVDQHISTSRMLGQQLQVFSIGGWGNRVAV